MAAQSIYKIKIKIPTAKNGSWFISYINQKGKMIIIKRKNAGAVYRLVKGLCSLRAASPVRGKTRVSVFYPHYYRNEIETPLIFQREAKYIQYAVACFLEDYLPYSTLRKAEREFLGSITNKNYSH